MSPSLVPITVRGRCTGHTPAAFALEREMTAESSPVAVRLLSILEERGWRGWTCIERVPAERATHAV